MSNLQMVSLSFYLSVICAFAAGIGFASHSKAELVLGVIALMVGAGLHSLATLGVRLQNEKRDRESEPK